MWIVGPFKQEGQRPVAAQASYAYEKALYAPIGLFGLL